MAKILVVAFELEGTNQNRFNDVSNDHWAYNDINTLVATGITSGTTPTTYNPNGNVTRAQMAVFIKRAIDYVEAEVPEVEEIQIIDEIIIEDEPKSTEPINVDEFKTEPSSVEKETIILSEELQLFFNLLNEERKKHNLHELKLASDVSEAAIFKAEDMRDLKYFDHVSPVYGNPRELLQYFEIYPPSVGENLHGGYNTPELALESLMNSPGHRANILNPNWTEVGVGYAQGGNVGHYWVQIFVTR
ncbi:CAP domain-containing protein [Bacillus sp. FJAT-45350]|uniref:CAP domain-containing protein n=1 Tax=Bacillus sp. FJAT-45350 TaxID=2011014 RepID=UPI000BB87A0A|nr:CAP domain-containing protein [Bacillus sp. FJAT-45350]